MKVLIETDVVKFCERAMPWATRAPVVNNVLTTTAESARDGWRAFVDALWIAVVDEDGEVVGAAMHTPPYHLFVCAMPLDVAPALAEALAAVRPDLRGVSGETATADAFVRAWQRVTGASVRTGLEQRVFSLSTVIAPAPVAGALRRATETDRDLLIELTTAFLREAVANSPSEDPGPVVDRVLAGGGAYLWEVDGQPVCFAGARPPAAGVARIGPVYTPPQHRRRGYAGACVAAVSQRILDAGADLCALYTDLANPISNSVYQRLGYRPVADSQEYSFTYP